MTLGIFLHLDDFQPVSPLTGSSMCGFEDPIYDFHKGDLSESCCEISLIDSFPVFQAMAIQCTDVALDGTSIFFSKLSLTFFLFKYKLSL